MKRTLCSLAAMAAVLVSLVQCTVKPYDDSWIKDELADIRAQIGNLQKSITALDAYKTLLDKGRLISDVVDHGDGTFTVHFADGTAPVTLDAGRGEPGQDGATPDFKIEDGNWYVSYDEGKTWDEIGSASAGDHFFQNVSVEGDYLVLVLIDGTRVRINLKGGQGGSTDPEEGKATIDQWVGKWDQGEDDFTVTIIKAGGNNLSLNYEAISIPLEYDPETGNLLLKMPQNRFVGGSTAAGSGVSYYLNLYDTGNDRINPSEGSLICTFKMAEDGSAHITPADASYYYFYARGYDNEKASWQSLTDSFYMYVDDYTMTPSTEGGDDDPGITYQVNADFKFQYYSNWFYVNAASGNYAFWTVPVSAGSLDDADFIKATLDDFGKKLAAGSDGTVDATTATNTGSFIIFSGASRYTTAPYYCSNGNKDEEHRYYVFMVGVDVTDGVKLTGDYNVITITWG